MTQITYTAGQDSGYQKFTDFYLDPMETVMLLKGYSGTGKSTLVQRMIQELPKLNQMMTLIDPDFKPYEVCLTATTNQAAEALAIACGINDTGTVHSLLGLRVHRDWGSGKTKLVISNGAPGKTRALIFIDEASYIDQTLLELIFKQVEDCKLVFIGDPGQLTPVQSNYMPAFKMDKNTIELTEPVRQDDSSPLKPLIAGFRKAVFEGTFPKISLHPGHIEYMDQAAFEAEAFRVFNLPDAPIAKVLAYTNDRVTYYNNLLSTQIHGTSVPLKDQRMINNSMVTNRASTIKTGEEVLLESVQACTDLYDTPGYRLTLRGKPGSYFLPESRALHKAAAKKAKEREDWSNLEIIDTIWIDLRPAFSCTINKSQGSTYHTVFIDLNDVNKTRTADALARMLYVGTSRAQVRVVYTGDLV